MGDARFMTMSDYELVQQALSTRLAELEELRLEYIGESAPPSICVTCYASSEDCCCVMPIFWPLPAALYKLRAEVRMDRAVDGA